ncbi:sensor histidine kinase [Nocardia yunnanensis]|uniref:Sensor histidine kinase n=1 Tax=Nocardia yunnanensis TaxID=2382165 RepID=A0A386ZIF9_9NOCA|nr:sensor histidine kinase [Nocardia yunnanensis]AYF77702.1 sensor histidine kinase [Nocardia yunnanensis]
MGAITDRVCAHQAFLYEGREEYLAGTLGFIRAGLERGEPVAVSVPTDNLLLLREALGSDADAVRLLDMTVEGRNPGQIIPGFLHAFADAYPDGPVRMIGEPVWAARSALEYPACVQHEALVNAAFRGREVAMLCPYNLRELPAHAIRDARATHPTVLDARGEYDSGSYDPERMLDRYNPPLPDPPATAETFAFDAALLSRARHTVAQYATGSGMSGDRVLDLELIVGETTANSVVHGGGRGVLAYWLENSQLCVQIRDAGHFDNPLAGRLPAGTWTAGGRGLLMVNQFAELVRLHTGPSGTTLRIHVSLT